MKNIVKFLYEKLPFKHRFFKILKLFWQPSELVFRHLHFKGILDLKIKGEEFKMQHYGYMIENEAFWLGLDNGWERASLNLWSKLSTDSQVIFDIGANTGIYGLSAQAINPHAKIYAFEPVRRVFDKLRNNIELNDYNIKAFEKAVSNINGTAIIYDPLGAEHVLSVTVNKDLTGESTETVAVEIETLRLDSFIKSENINKIDLMKIDVETHEAEVLEGMGEYLKKFKPTLLIEILNDEVGQAVEGVIKGLDYLKFNIDDKNNSLKQVENITKSSHFNYLLCSESVAKRLKIL